jgi:hypothetical protein
MGDYFKAAIKACKQISALPATLSQRGSNILDGHGVQSL